MDSRYKSAAKFGGEFGAGPMPGCIPIEADRRIARTPLIELGFFDADF
jgi:hypothetical protein